MNDNINISREDIFKALDAIEEQFDLLKKLILIEINKGGRER